MWWCHVKLHVEGMMHPMVVYVFPPKENFGIGLVSLCSCPSTHSSDVIPQKWWKEFIHVIHQYQVMSGNDVHLFKFLILSIMADKHFNRQQIDLSSKHGWICNDSIWAAKYVIKLTWTLLQLLCSIRRTTVVQLIKCVMVQRNQCKCD